MGYVGGRKLAVVMFKFGSIGAGSERQIESTMNLSERTFFIVVVFFFPKAVLYEE